MNFKQHSQISGGGVLKIFYLIHVDTEHLLTNDIFLVPDQK